MSETITNKQKGRPATPIVWPDNEFTVNDLVDKVELSRVSIQLRINKSLSSNELEEAGKRSSKGRPLIVYRRKTHNG